MTQDRKAKQAARDLSRKNGTSYSSARKLLENRGDYISHSAARSIKGQTLEFEMPSLIDPECTEVYVVNVGGDVGGTFASADAGILAAIRTGSGLMVYAHDEGGKGTFTFNDSSTYSSWVHPCDAEEEDASGRISLSEMKALEEADRISTEFGFIDKVDPHQLMDEVEINRAVIANLEGLRLKRKNGI